jgi:hypothetical protein
MSPIPQHKPCTRLPPLPPMKSFNSFIASQNNLTMSESEADELYKEYQLKYTEEISKHFFQNSKYEEWFREQYDPMLKVKQIPEMKNWAQNESAVIFKQLEEGGSEIMTTFRLTGLPNEKFVTASRGMF